MNENLLDAFCQSVDWNAALRNHFESALYNNEIPRVIPEFLNDNEVESLTQKQVSIIGLERKMSFINFCVSRGLSKNYALQLPFENTPNEVVFRENMAYHLKQILYSLPDREIFENYKFVVELDFNRMNL